MGKWSVQRSHQLSVPALAASLTFVLSAACSSSTNTSAPSAAGAGASALMPGGGAAGQLPTSSGGDGAASGASPIDGSGGNGLVPGSAGAAASAGGMSDSVAGGGASNGGSPSAGGSAAVAGSAGTGGAAASAGGQGAGGEPVIGMIKNAVIPGYFADPQIAEFDGKFYIYPTTDGYVNWTGSVFHAFSSANLASWKDEGIILDLGPDVSWADNSAWAPSIVLRNGTYYFYFCGAQQIGVATSTTPTGHFKDALGHALVTSNQYGVQSIDPYAFVDDDGRAYLYFGSGGARVVELNSDMISFKGTPTSLTLSGFNEGSVVFKRNGIYYYMWSENDTRSVDYHVSYATSKSPLGPFTKAAINPILQKNTSLGILATGHHSVLGLANGDYYIAYHRWGIPNGDGYHRETCIDRMLFNGDGTIVPVVPTL